MPLEFGVPTNQTDKSGGKIIYRNINVLLLNRPVTPLMLWKPYEPIYPKLVRNVADGLTLEERKEMRNGGLNYVPWMKLSRIMNGPLMRPFIPKNAGFGAPCSYSIQGRAEEIGSRNHQLPEYEL
ncbi:CRS2-ASSOCIATED FACTOR 2 MITOCHONDRIAL [Salix purpurea]|uniref:CRS2-ASSOCIATED FACTOR 2 MITOCHONDRIAL n=1 Tax=Salix purpurea TaxID=77065 RepID=A0A9Q0WRU6_SALPP|nr:CRS2-ASSOCIATED FACTOR 2 MITOCHONDRIAL [Salix purpurea]